MKIVVLMMLISVQVFASDKMKQVKEGMSKEEVLKILGKPEDVHVDEKNEATFMYDTFLIGFKKDKVYEIFDHGI